MDFIGGCDEHYPMTNNRGGTQICPVIYFVGPFRDQSFDIVPIYFCQRTIVTGFIVSMVNKPIRAGTVEQVAHSYRFYVEFEILGKPILETFCIEDRRL